MNATLPPQIINAKQIDEIIWDAELQQHGARIFFAIDPHEVFDFCFPFDPAHHNHPNAATIADDQAALYEVFFARPEKTILLPEYKTELRALLHYFEGNLDRVYDAAELLEELIRMGGLAELESDRAEIVERVVQESFNIVLAVAMGIYSLGVDRFQSLFREQRFSTAPQVEPSSDQRIIAEIESRYTRTSLMEVIYDDLKSTFPHSGPQPERRARSNFNDARAIDRMIYLNKALEEAFQNGALTRRCVLFYLSTAHRTERIFSLRAVHAALPMIDGSPFSIWRTRHQVFWYAVHRSKQINSAARLKETVDNLRTFADMVQTLQRGLALVQSASHRDMAEMANVTHPQQRDFFQQTLHQIEETRIQIANLGLVNAIDDYQRLLEAKPSKHSHRGYLELLDFVFSSGIKDVAIERMRQKQAWMMLNSQGALPFKEPTKSRFNPAYDTFRSRKDLVVDINQSMPTKCNVENVRFKAVVNALVLYYKDPSRTDLLEKACKEFAELDVPVESRKDPERELVRCLLYLAFKNEGGEERAFNYALELASNMDMIVARPLILKEYLYLLVWCARRLGRFSQADLYLKLAIDRLTEDPRFHHGRSLNTYAWLRRGPSNCPYDIKAAIQDAIVATRLYRETASDNQDALVGNYNNLAHFYAREITMGQYRLEESQAILSLARMELDKLKECLSKDQWDPLHPEYFYTEAYLTYQEFLVEMSSGENPLYLSMKLQTAKGDIDTALRLYGNDPDYQDLQESVKRALAKLKH